MAQVEKKYGVTISLDANITDSAEALYDPNTKVIKVNPRTTTEDALVGVVLHELTHVAEESGWYPQYRDIVLSIRYNEDNFSDSAAFQRDVEAKIKRYAEAGISLTPERAIAEIVAQETRDTIFADEAAVKNLVEREPSLARRIMVALNDIIRYMREIFGEAISETRIEQAKVLLETALNDRENKAPKSVDAYGEYTYTYGEPGSGVPFEDLMMADTQYSDPKYLNDQVLIEKGTSLPLKTGTPAQGDGETSDKDHPSVVSLLQQVKDVKKEDAAIKSEKKYSLIDKDTDTAYLEAVNAGDMDAAQKMVDEVAKAAGYVKAWHNTNADFTTFDKALIGTNQGTSLGKGFYVALDENAYNQGYGEKRMNLYAMAENPYHAEINNQETFTEAQAKELLAKYGRPRVEGYNPGSELYELATSIYNEGVLSDLQDKRRAFSRLDYLARESGVTRESILKILGYDGVVAGPQLMLFDENQLKSADPITYDDAGNPISLSERFNALSKDIRYSLTNQEQDSDDAPLTPAQAKYFKDSKVRDDKGKLLKMYHGTSKAGFTEFAWEKQEYGLFGPGFYFTDSDDVAWSYTQKGKGENRDVYEVYLDIKNPMDMDAIANPEEWGPALRANSVRFKFSDKTTNEHVFRAWQDEIEDQRLARWEAAEETLSLFDGLGYDGITHIGGGRVSVDSPKHRVYIAFNPEQIKNASNFNPTSSRDIRYSLSDQDTEKINKAVDDLLRKFGAIPQGEKAKNTAEIPVKTSDELTTRKHVRTVSEADILDIAGCNELNRKIVAEHFSYEPISDDDAMAYAAGMDSGKLERVWNRSIEGDAIPGKRQIAVGERLLVQYAEAGETDSAMRMIAELSEVLTRAGQTVQAARLLKKTTNAGALHYIKRAVDKLNEGIKGEGVKLNPDLVNDLTQAKTPQERDAAIKAIQKDAGQQIPPNWKTRLNAWRYFAMLGNPRTHIRNIVGNAIFMPAVKIKNMIGAGIEAATGQDRTKSVVLDRGLRRAAMQDAEAHMEELMGGGKYNPTGEIEQFKRSFGESSLGKGMEALTEFNSALLEKEDGIFLKRHYANALAGYLQANGMTLDDADETALTKARQYAVDEAKKATYRDASAVAEYINKAAKKGGMWELMVEGIMPFKKTPINILKRGVEYSPIGLIETVTRGVKQLKDEKITPTQFIDKISAGMTGTMIAGLGLFLNSLGLIRIGGGDDKEEEFERQGGAQNYSIEIAGYSITLDWMTPASMPLFVGASLGKLIEEEKQNAGIADVLNAGLQALQGLMEPMLSLSMLSGIDQVIKSASVNEENAITAIMIESAINYTGQFVPTLLGQVARTLDPERRRIYTDKNIPLDSNIQRFIEQQQNKLPWLSTKNEPYIDIWGEAEKSGSGWLRALENFISPAYINELTPDAVEELLLEVYRQTGDDGVLPQSASKYFKVNGETINLDSKQYTDFSVTRGKAMRSGLEEMMGDDRFTQADMQGKTKMIKDMLEFSTQKAKMQINSEYAGDKWVKDAIEADNPAEAIFMKYENAEYDAKRVSYRTSALEAALTGDYDSLEAATGALMQAHILKNPDATDKQALSAAKRYLNDQAKAAYIAAYQAEDEELMERIEDSFYDVGIAFNYRDWMKDKE